METFTTITLHSILMLLDRAIQHETKKPISKVAVVSRLSIARENLTALLHDLKGGN
jgi:hypothetical protein